MSLLIILSMMGVGLFGTLIQLSGRIQHQIELDQQTGKIVLQLRASIITMEKSETRLKIAKAAMVAACFTLIGCPEAEAIYEADQKIEEVIQKAARLNWLKQQAIWLKSASILEMTDFPDLDEVRDKGEATLRLTDDQLTSTAKIWKGGPHGWSVAWIE